MEECRRGSAVVVAVAPGHKKDRNPSGFMHDNAKRLLRKLENLEDGTQQLIRTETVEKQATSGRARSKATHRGTIEIKGNPDNKEKVVVILDDIWTSGNTLGVCKEVMETTKPKKIKLFVLGKTVPKDID